MTGNTLVMKRSGWNWRRVPLHWPHQMGSCTVNSLPNKSRDCSCRCKIWYSPYREACMFVVDYRQNIELPIYRKEQPDSCYYFSQLMNNMHMFTTVAMVKLKCIGIVMWLKEKGNELIVWRWRVNWKQIYIDGRTFMILRKVVMVKNLTENKLT